MKKYLILCVDDEMEILDSVMQDLKPFEQYFMIEMAQSVDEADAVIQENQEDHPLALIICDHIMPQKTGIDFLITLQGRPKTKMAKKILLTGQAGFEDTIQAINKAGLDYFIAKPWKSDELKKMVFEQLTTFIIQAEDDLMPWLRVLDQVRLLQAISDRRNSSDS